MSDWALGKKLNSQIADVPLNHLIWLNDYKTYGENSYVFRNKDILHELYQSPIAINDAKTEKESASYVIKEVGLRAYINNVYGIDISDFTSIESISDLVGNPQAVVKLVDANSSILSVDDFIDAIDGKGEAIDAILETEYAKSHMVAKTGTNNAGVSIFTQGTSPVILSTSTGYYAYAQGGLSYETRSGERIVVQEGRQTYRTATIAWDTASVSPKRVVNSITSTTVTNGSNSNATSKPTVTYLPLQ